MMTMALSSVKGISKEMAFKIMDHYKTIMNIDESIRDFIYRDRKLFKTTCDHLLAVLSFKF